MSIENEHCWILIGSRRGPFWLAKCEQLTVGAPSTVEFDHDWTTKRDESEGDVVGFLHTHPSGLLRPSKRDIATMRAWVSSFGRPMLCLIACGKEVTGYLFRNDECEGVMLDSCEWFDQNMIVAYDRNERVLDLATSESDEQKETQ